MASPRFTFFAGKGGVGKTTCAAAAAVRAAEEGRRVLVVSTDPAHSLADALNVELGAEPRRVRRAAGELFAAELDADRALSRWLGEREVAIRTIAERGTYFDDEDIDRILSLAFPGVDELVGLVELLRLARARDWADVVVDTAPTGHLLRLLEMPATLERLGDVLDVMHEKHRFLASRLRGAYRPDFADEAIFAIAEEARTVRALLEDAERASFTWVTLAEELPVRESEDGIAAVRRLGVAVPRVVVNRVAPALGDCALCVPRARDQQRWLPLLHRLGADVVELPLLAAEPRGAAALLAFALAATRSRCTWSLVPVEPAPRRRRAARAASRHPESASPAPLGVPRSARLVLVGGKGGVGKTTVAAASALALARERQDQRVLLISTDPAHSLGDVLGLDLDDNARPVTQEPNLFVRELDARTAWERERDRYRASIDELFSATFRGAIDVSFDRAVLEDLLDLSPPGLDELLAIVTLLDAFGFGASARQPSAPFDVVVVDTAPTGHTLRLLALPESAREWAHALMSIVLKYREVVGLGDFAQSLTDLARRLRQLIAMLHDPARTAFVAVTRPLALPREETVRLARGLGEREVPLTRIVANAVTPEGTCPRCQAAAKLERGELGKLARLASRTARVPALVLAPAEFPPPRGVAALARWRGRWVEQFGTQRGGQTLCSPGSWARPSATSTASSARRRR